MLSKLLCGSSGVDLPSSVVTLQYILCLTLDFIDMLYESSETCGSIQVKVMMGVGNAQRQ